jgi:hypothetical protein
MSIQTVTDRRSTDSTRSTDAHQNSKEMTFSKSKLFSSSSKEELNGGAGGSGRPRRNSKSSTHSKSLGKPPVNSTSSQNTPSQPGSMSAIGVVENIVIPYTLKTIISEETTYEHRWLLLDGVVKLWKSLCILGGKYKVNFIWNSEKGGG